MQENHEVTPCFVHLRRIDDNLINLYLRKYGLKINAASGDSEREETHRESLPLWSGTMSKKSLKRKREDGNDSSFKMRQKYSTNEKMKDSCPSQKYFSNTGTHKINFSTKKKNYLEHETSCSCKFNQRKKNYLKVSSPILKILEEKNKKKLREKNKCSRQISQAKVKSMMEELKKVAETQEETESSDAMAHISEQRFKNINKILPVIQMCKHKSNENNGNTILVNGGKQFKGETDEECSQFKQVVESEQKIVANVSQTEKNVKLHTIGRRYGSRVCDTHLNSNVKNEPFRTNNLSLDEDEYDSRGEDSEDDKQTVIFDEKFDTLGKLKESSEKVSECKQQSVKINLKGGKLKSPRTLKRRKPSLVRIIKKEKMVVKKKLGKPTKKIGRKTSERGQIKRSKETITRSNKFVEKFEDILAEVGNLVKHLHDTHKIIIHLKKDMEENEKLSEHFKTVIEAQQENYRKEIWRNQETIMKGYDKMMSFCKKSSIVSLEISKRTFLSIEDVENVLSRCILVENALEKLKPSQKFSAVEKNVSKETEDQGMSSCAEKEWSIGTVAASSDSSEIIGKEQHGQIISLDECQNQLAPEKGLRISNNLYPNDIVKPSVKHLTYSNSASSVPCSTSTYVLKERQVMPPRQSIDDHSEGLLLHKSHSHESNHTRIPYQSCQKSRLNFMNKDRGQVHYKNSIPMPGFLPGGRRSDFVQHGKPREEHIQPGNNVQNQRLISEMRHHLPQQQLTKSLSQILTGSSVQQILTTKRPPRPQNPIPCVLQPEVEMNSERDKRQCQQQPGFIHSDSVQRRIGIESDFAVPFKSVTSGFFNQSRSGYLPHLMKSNTSMFGPYTPIRGIPTPLSSMNNMSASHSMASQKVIQSHLPQPSTTVLSASNTSAMYTSTPVRTHTSTFPVLRRQLQNPPSFVQNMKSCRTTGEGQPSLRVSYSVQNIPSSMKALHPVTQSSGSSLNFAVAEQLYVSKPNEQALQASGESKNSVACGSCIVLKSSTIQKSKSESQLLDPTIPQKLTMKNQRLQAGTILISSGDITKSKSQLEEKQMNPVIKVGSTELQGQVKMPGTQKIARRNSSRKYECAGNGCKNAGIRICKGCESVIYCSGTCHLIHWEQKHKEECAKLRELRS